MQILLTVEEYQRLKDASKKAPAFLIFEKPCSLFECKARLVKAVVRHCGGNLSEAAKILGAHRSTIGLLMRTEE